MALPKKESGTVEFKQSLNDSVILSLVAFSNAVGGSVYIGIYDDGKATGITLGAETVPRFVNEIKQKTVPSVIPNVEIISLKNDRDIVVLTVIEYPLKPVSFLGSYYKRINAANHKLTSDEIANIYLQSLNSSWDMFPDPTHDLNDIDHDKVLNCINLMKNKGMTINESTLTFLSKYNLIREGKPTFAATLMFCNRITDVTTIELGRFKTNITIIDTARTKSDIISQVDEVMNYVKSHINCELVFTGTPQHTEKWQYPLEAIREIVLNMIVHRDYRSTSDSIIKIFDDKIEFFNPGRLPDNITIDDLLNNTYISNPRNKKIADVFKDFGWIEKYGSGIGRIIQQFLDLNLPIPTFSNIADGFLVTVFCEINKTTVEENEKITVEETPQTPMNTGKEANKITVEENVKMPINSEKRANKTTVEENHEFTVEETEKSTVEETEKSTVEENAKMPINTGQGANETTVEETEEFTVEETEKFTVEENEKKILMLLKENPNLTQEELVKITGLTRRGIEWNLSQLKSLGLIKRVGPNKGGYWKVKKTKLNEKNNKKK